MKSLFEHERTTLRDYSHILSRFERLRPTARALTWSALCPVHEDRYPSLLIWVGRTGCLMARCLANQGCSWKGIVAAIGSQEQDWFPEKDEPKRRCMHGKIVATYRYLDEKGQLAYECLRIEPGADGRRKDFKYRRPAREGENGRNGWVWDLERVEKILYNLPALLDPHRASHPVFLVEGEKCVETLRSFGLLATTNPCGAGKWLPEFGKVLRGRRCVILPDNDRPGRTHAMQVAGSLLYWHAASIRIVHLLGLPEKGDVADWISDSLERIPREQTRRALIEQVTKTQEYLPHQVSAKTNNPCASRA